MIILEKTLLFLSNSRNHFFHEISGDQSGEFECWARGLKE